MHFKIHAPKPRLGPGTHPPKLANRFSNTLLRTSEKPARTSKSMIPVPVVDPFAVQAPQIGGTGAGRWEAHNRIKDAGYRRKQERVETGSRGWFNPLISPKKSRPDGRGLAKRAEGAEPGGLARRPWRSMTGNRLSML